MKVFACRRQGSYSGGVILVAANTVSEAFHIASKEPSIDWMFEWIDKDGFVSYEGAEDATLVSHYYPFADWFVMEELSINVTEPKVIIEGGYSE